jgi:hypothetical protein
VTDPHALSATTTDGRHLHLERHGEGEPVVVCVSGMGVSRSMWGGVIPLVAQATTIVAYDRAGLGRSDPDPRPRTLGRLADDSSASSTPCGADPDGPYERTQVRHGVSGSAGSSPASTRAASPSMRALRIHGASGSSRGSPR